MQVVPQLNETLVAIADEHESLANHYQQVFDSLKGGPEQRVLAARLLDELIDAVIAHFAHEEEGGYYLHVVEKAPSRASVVDELKHQHGELLRMIVRIAEAARGENQSAESCEVVQRDFADFLKRCSEHEARENRLVQEVYLLDIAAAD